MGIVGYATAEGTARYRDRMVAAGATDAHHFRDALGGLAVSSIGLGTYLGGYDALTDQLYLEAIKGAVALGCNVLDTAINYRCQRSERVIGQALRDLTAAGIAQRDEILVTTKGGFIPYDDTPPSDTYGYFQRVFVQPGIVKVTDLVADCHCMTPDYLRHQIDQSLANLGLAAVDVYYLHNPETQLDHVSRSEFLARMRAAFETLELAVAEGKLRVYGTATWNGYRRRATAPDHLSLEALVGLAREVGGERHHFKVVQLPYNLGMPEAYVALTQTVHNKAQTVLEAAQALGVYVMSSASVLQGQLTKGLPGFMRSVLGEGTDAQRSIQMVRSTPGLGTALVGMKQVEHVRENLAVAKLAPLSPLQLTSEFAKVLAR